MKNVRTYTTQGWLNWFKTMTDKIAIEQRRYLRYKDQREAIIKELQSYVDQKLRITDIADIKCVSKQRVQQLYQQYGVKPYKRPAKDTRKPKILGTYKSAIDKSGIHPQQLIDLYNSGHSLSEIAKIFNHRLSVNAIHKRLKRAGIKLRMSTRQRVSDIEIIHAYQAGLSIQKIADMYAMTYNGIYRRVYALRKKGLL